MDSLKSKVYLAAEHGQPLTLWALLSSQNAETSNRIVSSYTEGSTQRLTPFLIAARNGHLKVVTLLIGHYDIYMEQTGTVQFDEHVNEGATALWCAARAGHLDIVKALILSKANVNHKTETDSTPLRAACFDGRADIVRYLIENNADVNIPGKYNNTCLMLASYKRHYEVVSLLLQCDALVNYKANCGETSLHFAALNGDLQIVKLLISHGAKMYRNLSNMSPLHIAAECSHAKIVEFFVSQDTCLRIHRIEALELLGASFGNAKYNYNIVMCYHYFWLALQERYVFEECPVLKKISTPLEAYNYHKECETVAELESLKENNDALHMESLVVRERILGEDYAEIPTALVYRGAVYADHNRFDRCNQLWLRALELRQHNARSISKDLLRFSQVFSQMYILNIEIDIEFLIIVLEKTILEFSCDRKTLVQSSSEELIILQKNHEENIHTMLYLLSLVIKLKLDDNQSFQMKKLVYKFLKMNLHLHDNGYSPLHMILDENTYVDDFHVSKIIHFPNYELTQLFILCGASVNAADAFGQTPLHTIVKFTHPIEGFLTLHDIIQFLLNSGAHPDIADMNGKTPSEVSISCVAEILLRTKMKASLKCICARAVRKMNIYYHNQIPRSLEDFVDMH